MVSGDAVELLQTLAPGSVDMVATDPPYNPQLKLTMAGGAAAAQVGQPPDGLRHGLRRPRRTSPTVAATRNTSTG